MIKKQTVPAGDFKVWLDRTRDALIKDEGNDVPCGSCTACCTSSYFIHIRPEEKKTLASIPKQVLFPAPGMPKGNYVMGYNEKGHCPMFKDNKCSIYENRPQTCRSYDCRVFYATGLPAGDKRKALINQQVERWRFKFNGTDAGELYNIIRKTARFLVENKKKFPKDVIPSNTTQLAILAIRIYPFFTKEKDTINDSDKIDQIRNFLADQ